MKRGEKIGVRNKQTNPIHYRSRQHAARLELQSKDDCALTTPTLLPDAQRIKLPPTNAELKEQFMSDEALALKRKTPMFNK